MTTDAGGVDSTYCGGETGEACAVQGLNETINVGTVRLIVLSIDESCRESEEKRGEDENHDSSGGWWRGGDLEETWDPSDLIIIVAGEE